MGDEEPHWYQVERAGEQGSSWEPIGKDIKGNEFQITDIKPEDYFRFRVRPCNRFGDGDPSVEVIRDRLVDPVPPRKPRVPPNLTDIDDTSCQLSWPTISGATAQEPVRYQLERLTGSEAWSPIAKDLSEPSYTIRDLNPEDEYWFRIRGLNRFGLGEPSPHAIRYRKYDPVPPKAVSGVPQLSDLSDTSVRLSWSPHRQPAPETLYIVEILDSSAPTNNWYPLPHEIRGSSFDINDLPPTLDYRFRVRAKNKYGTSEASREAYRPKRYDSSAFKIPGQPLVSDLDDTSCKLSWRTLEIPDVYYRIESMDETQKDWSLLADKLYEVPYTIRDLKPDLDYRFRIRGYSDRYSILGDPSIEVMRYGPYSSSTKRPPRSVGLLTLTEIDDTTYRLSWPHNPETGVKYSVEQFDSERCEWIHLSDSQMDPWYEIRNLRTDVDYKFRVRASNRYGYSEPSLEAMRPRRKEEKGPPGRIPGIPTLLDTTDTACRLMWQPVYGSKSSGLMYIIESYEYETWTEIARNITLTNYDVKNLDSDREYSFRIRAKNEYGYSEPSAVVRRTANVQKPREVAPRPVTSLPTIHEISDSHVRLSWEPSRLPGNAKQTTIYYCVEGYNSESSGWSILVDDLDECVVAFDNLDCNKDYTFRVRAKNEFGISEPSVPVTRYKKRTPFRGAPTAPIAPPMIDETTATSIHLSWSAPSYVNQAPQDYIYIIEMRDDISLVSQTLIRLVFILI